VLPSRKKTTSRIYIYKVRDETGKSFCGLVEAPDPRAIKKNLRSSNLYFVSARPFRTSQLYRKKVSLETLLMFTHRMYSLIEAGIPILSSLNILWRQTEDLTMQLVVSRMMLQIESGNSLSEAVAEFPNIFSNIYIAMITVGESGAGLVPLLKELSLYLEAQKQFISRIKRATIYPSIVMVIALLVMLFMFIFVVPTFQRVLNSINAEMPMITQVLMFISDTIRTVYFPVISLAVLLGLYYLYRYMERVPKMRRILDDWKMKVPILGEIVYILSLGRFTRTLGLLSGSGLQIIRSLQIARSTIGNQKIEDAVHDVEQQISQGISLYEAFRSVPVFPVIMLEMVGIAEKKGNISVAFEKLAVHFDEKADYLLNRFLVLLEPILIIVVGSIVGFILAGVYLPIFSLWKGFAG